MKKTYSHGELCIFESNESIPVDAKKMKASKIGYIVANSETTGNHHVVEEKEGIEIYEKNGVMYLKADVEVDVFCVIKERHDKITLEPGTYKMKPAKEYDYYTLQKRNVAD